MDDKDRKYFDEKFAHVDENFAHVDERFASVKGYVDQRLATERQYFDERFNQLSVKVDATLRMTRDFRTDAAKRFDAIGRYMRTQDKTMQEHEERLNEAEFRLDQLEGDKDTG